MWPRSSVFLEWLRAASKEANTFLQTQPGQTCAVHAVQALLCCQVMSVLSMQATTQPVLLTSYPG